MLGFYGVVPALNPPPLAPHLAASFCQWIYHLGIPLTSPPPSPTDTHSSQPSSPPSGPQGMRSSLWKLVGQPEMPTVGGNTNCDQESLWDKGENIQWLKFGKLQCWQENNTSASIISHMWCPQVLCATRLGSLRSVFWKLQRLWGVSSAKNRKEANAKHEHRGSISSLLSLSWPGFHPDWPARGPLTVCHQFALNEPSLQMDLLHLMCLSFPPFWWNVPFVALNSIEWISDLSISCYLSVLQSDPHLLLAPG